MKAAIHSATGHGRSLLPKRPRGRTRVWRRSIYAAASQANVLVVGGGGREHALCWKIRQSDLCGTLYCAPGNAGILKEPDIRRPPIQDINDHQEVVRFCKESGIELVVVGPEAPLVDGMVDDLDAAGILAFGPSRAAAQLEGSKSFMKAQPHPMPHSASEDCEEYRSCVKEMGFRQGAMRSLQMLVVPRTTFMRRERLWW